MTGQSAQADDASGQLLPPNVRDYRRATPYSTGSDLQRAPALVRGRCRVAAMAVPHGCEQYARSLELVRAALAPIGIDVRGRPVASLAAVRSGPADFDLVDSSTVLDYPDPASFLQQPLGGDVPRAWLPASTRSSMRRLAQLRDNARDTAAVKLAPRIETRDVPVVFALITSFGYQSSCGSASDGGQEGKSGLWRGLAPHVVVRRASSASNCVETACFLE